ncbi:MAG: alpha-ketoacid dehydrogenase subunit beta, partial [Alicyclobacillus mali]
GLYRVPIGKAKRVREGEDVSVFAWGSMLRTALKVAESLERERGFACDVIDLRTLYPLDRDAIVESVQKTGRAVVVHEAHKTAGLGAEIVSLINEEALLYLRAPVKRIAGFDVPVPFFALEDEYMPTEARIRAGIEETITF